MQTKQSVTNNHQPSTACGEKRAAMKLPIRSTVIAAFGVLSMLLPVSQTAHAQRTPPPNSRREFVAPVVFQAAGPSGASIQSTVDAFRAVPGFETNNGNNPGPLPDGRREINWDGGSPDVLDTTAPVTPFNVFLNTRGSQFTTPGLGLSQAPPSGGPREGWQCSLVIPPTAKSLERSANRGCSHRWGVSLLKVRSLYRARMALSRQPSGASAQCSQTSISQMAADRAGSTETVGPAR